MTTLLPLWSREGTCQPSVCGSACCRFMVLDVNPVYRDNPDLAQWVGLHGIEIASLESRVIARVPLACSALNGEGRCAVYGRPERPQMCGDFPRGPGDLIGLDGACTYSFRRSDDGNR